MEFNQKVTNVEVDPEQWTMEEVVSISSIGEIEVSNVYFTIGPVPVENKLNVYFLNTDSIPQIITIYNLAGQQVYSAETNEIHFELDTSGFINGAYFISVSNGNDVITEKFVK